MFLVYPDHFQKISYEVSHIKVFVSASQSKVSQQGRYVIIHDPAVIHDRDVTGKKQHDC
jgi:hypothetical protein